MEVEKKYRSWKQVGVGFLIFLIGGGIAFNGLQNGSGTTLVGGLLALIGLLVMATSSRKRKYKIKI